LNPLRLPRYRNARQNKLTFKIKLKSSVLSIQSIKQLLRRVTVGTVRLRENNDSIVVNEVLGTGLGGGHGGGSRAGEGAEEAGEDGRNGGWLGKSPGVEGSYKQGGVEMRCMIWRFVD